MPWDTSEIAARRSDGSGEILRAFSAPDAQAQQVRFAPGGALAAFLTDVDGFLNLWVFDRDFNAKPVLAEPFEHGDPSWGPGQRSFAWSPDGNRIAFNRNEGGFGRLCVADVATGSVEEVARGVHGALSWQGERLAALRSGARTPTEIVVYDVQWQRAEIARGPVAGFESAEMVEPELVEWDGEDGAVVFGRLYRPDGLGHRQRSASAHLLGSWRSQLAEWRRVQRPLAVLARSWLRGARAGPPRFERPRPCVPAGDARTLGRPRHR